MGVELRLELWFRAFFTMQVIDTSPYVTCPWYLIHQTISLHLCGVVKTQENQSYLNETHIHLLKIGFCMKYLYSYLILPLHGFVISIYVAWCPFSDLCGFIVNWFSICSKARRHTFCWTISHLPSQTQFSSIAMALNRKLVHMLLINWDSIEATILWLDVALHFYVSPKLIYLV